MQNFSLLFLLFANFANPAWGAVRTAHPLKFSETRHHFGEIMRGQKLAYRFSFVNASKEPVIIRGVQAPCGCTTAGFDANRIYEPGAQGEVSVDFDTTQFEGQIEKTLTVMTSQVSGGSIALSVAAFIKSEIEVYPPLIDFGDVYPGNSSSRSIRITPKNISELQLSEVKINEKVASYELVPDGRGFILNVSLKDGLAKGFYKETVYIKNNSKFLPELPIALRANVRSNIGIEPTYVEFGAVPKGGQVERTIQFSGDSNSPLEPVKSHISINGLPKTSFDDGIFVEVLDPKGPMREVKVKLKNAQGIHGSVHGGITFRTAEKEEITVDFYAFFL